MRISRKTNQILLFIFFVFILHYLLGCSMLKRNKVTLKQEKSESEIEFSVSQKDFRQQQKNNLTDSTVANYYVEFLPKGKFTYTPTTGFTGEANRVLIKGNTKKLLQFNEQVDINKQQVVGRVAAKKEQEVVATNEVNKQKVNLRLFWFVVGVVLIVGVYLYRRL